MCNLWDREQYTYALFIVDKVNNCGLEKKKKRGKRGEKRRRGFQLKANGHLKSFFNINETIYTIRHNILVLSKLKY